MRSRKSEGPDGVHPGFQKERTYQCENVMCNLSLKINFIPRETESNKCDTILSRQGRFGEL